MEYKKYNLSYNPNVPRVHLINSTSLIRDGWERKGSNYTKEGNTISYDGYQWKINGKEVIQFMEEIKI